MTTGRIAKKIRLTTLSIAKKIRLNLPTNYGLFVRPFYQIWTDTTLEESLPALLCNIFSGNDICLPRKPAMKEMHPLSEKKDVSMKMVAKK